MQATAEMCVAATQTAMLRGKRHCGNTKKEEGKTDEEKAEEVQATRSKASEDAGCEAMEKSAHGDTCYTDGGVQGQTSRGGHLVGGAELRGILEDEALEADKARLLLVAKASQGIAYV